MGRPMVHRLRQTRYQVTAHDHSEPARHHFADETWLSVTDDAAALAGSDVVITMLPDSDAVENVLVASNLYMKLRPGATVIDMSSSDPKRTRELASMLSHRGVALLDAPVSGGVEGAVTGSLSVMVGGTTADVQTWHPLLERFGTRIVQVGQVGAGHTAKALNDLLSATALLITGEALLVASRFGLDPQRLLDALNGSSGRNSATERKFPEFILTGTFSSGFSAQLMGKDIAIAMSLAHDTGTQTPLAGEVASQWSRLSRRLEPGADHTEIVRPQEQDANAELRTSEAVDKREAQ
jgi:3-hydroxyisobutyrate dehydrogenase